METDPAVYQSLSADLAGRPGKIIDRYSRRIAVFSDPPGKLGVGEIRMKSKLWDFLDEAIAGGITTLYTGLSYGADSAAAELFTLRKQENRNIRIVHIPVSRNWLSETDPALKGFAVNTFRNQTDFTKLIEKTSRNESETARDIFITYQCLHITLVMDLNDPADDSYAWRIFEYAVRNRPGSISHQIHIIGINNEPKSQPLTEGQMEPVQGSLF